MAAVRTDSPSGPRPSTNGQGAGIRLGPAPASAPHGGVAVHPDPQAGPQLVPAQRVSISSNGSAPSVSPAATAGATATLEKSAGEAPRAPDADDPREAGAEPDIPSLVVRPNHSRTLIEWTAVLAGALLVALLIKVLLLQAFMIPSESMTPSLNVGDRVLVNKLSYDLHDIRRGDVVVFRRPPAARSGADNSDLIKRVIGLPGDVVEGSRGGVFVNGRRLPEPYLPRGEITGDFAKTTVGVGQIFVMGDNRQNSRDSRFFGTVPESLVVGRAFLRVWPLLHIKLF